MTKEERQKIESRIALLQQQQMNLKNKVGQYYQAIAETIIAFDRLGDRVEELQSQITPKKGKQNATPSV